MEKLSESTKGNNANTLLCVVIFPLYCLLKMMEGTREVIDNDW